MITHSKQTATKLIILDLVLLLSSFPFIVCDFYYADRDYSCIWIPISSYNINFPLQRWLRVDGAMLISFVTVMLIIAIMICLSQGCECLYPVHALIGGIISLFRLAWLIVGAVLFWGYLNKSGGLCAPNIRNYMFANLIIGLVLIPLFLVAACLYPCAPLPMINTPIKVPTTDIPTYRGTTAAVY